MSVLQLPKKHVQMKCKSDTCGGTCYASTLGVCSVCQGIEGSLTTHCIGRPLTESEADLIYRRNHDYKNGRWFQHKDSKSAFPSNPMFY